MERMRAATRQGEPRLGMIQSRIVFKQRRDRLNSTGVLLFPNGVARDRDYEAPVADGAGAGPIFAASAGAAFYRRSMLEETRLPTGYFDRTFFMFYEDVDLGWRCRLAGWDALYVPDAVACHAFHGSASRKRNFVETQSRKNRLRYLLKNGSKRLIIAGLARSLYDVLSVISDGGLRAIPEIAEAVRDGLRQRPLVLAMAKLGRDEVERRWVTPRPKR
jgi:GT2 family glycosyltransferase